MGQSAAGQAGRARLREMARGENGRGRSQSQKGSGAVMPWLKVLWVALFLFGWGLLGAAVAPFVGRLLERKGREQWTGGESGTGCKDSDTTE